MVAGLPQPKRHHQPHQQRVKRQRQLVKVQRPGVAAQVALDLQILAGVAEWADAHAAIAHTLNLPMLVDEFSYTLHNELDYRREGYNADHFRRNFAGDASIHIPRVHWDFSTGRVLTMERVSGIKIADVAVLDGIDRRKVEENAVHLMMSEVFEFCFFHADPHPGNFFVQPDGSIALIDFGMVGRLDDSNSKYAPAFCGGVTAMIRSERER